MIDISKYGSDGIVHGLKVLQASVHILCAKVNGYRINIVGSNFYEYHAFLGLVHEKLEKSYYDTGERIKMLGGMSNFSVKDMLELSVVDDESSAVEHYDDMVKTMNQDFNNLSSLARSIFASAGPLSDAGTIALVTGLCFNVFEHFAWETHAMMQGE